MSIITLLKAGLLTMLLAATLPQQAWSQAATGGRESTWDRIQRTHKIRVGCVPEVPYTAIDTKTGGWVGFNVSLTEDIARRLGVDWECVSTTWGTVALEIQAGKIDFAMALGRTPQRELVIDFAGPMYNQVYLMVNRTGLKTATWQDYNNPETRVAVVVGSTNEKVLKEVMPLATEVGLTTQGGSPSLAVVSGRADAYLSSVITGIIAKGRNPSIGDLVFPTPIVQTPNYVGLAKESDKRFSEFMQKWADDVRTSGKAEKLARESLVGFGVPAEAIPADLHFAGGS